MLINSIKINCNNDYKKKSLPFKSWKREVRTNTLINRNDTSFFRDGDLFTKLIDYLVKFFKNDSKVNIYNYGCSIGEEAYSVLMYLISKFPEDIVNKFTPITAKDIDNFVIKKAINNDPHIICSEEKENINKFTNNKLNHFLEYKNGQYIIRDILKNKLDFRVADIKEDYKNINPNKSVVLMRNFLPYLNNSTERQKLLNNIGHQLQKDSFIMIGEFDLRGTDWKINNQIIDAGFERTPVEYLFKKKD